METNKVGIIFGVTGQIGSYLAEYLLSLGYKVIGVARRSSFNNTGRLTYVLPHKNFSLAAADVTDSFSLSKIFASTITDKDTSYEVYNLAAQSYVAVSFVEPIATNDITGVGHLNILECLFPFHKQGFKLRTFAMCSSEIFGSKVNSLGYQDFDTPFWPNSPYAASKLFMFHMNRIYRESYGMYNTSGVIFNTESPRRGEEFVTRKITKWFANWVTSGNVFLMNNMLEKLQLGNINASRDWTHAKDTVRAIHLINSQSIRPKDYCVASGATYTVRDFMAICYEKSKLYCDNINKDMILPLEDLYEINENFIRPNEVPYLRGDSSKLREEFNWRPEISFEDLVGEMLASDIELALKNRNSTKKVMS